MDYLGVTEVKAAIKLSLYKIISIIFTQKKHPYKIVKQNILNKIDSSRWKNYSKLCYNYFEKKMTMCLFFIEYKILIYIQNWQML